MFSSNKIWDWGWVGNLGSLVMLDIMSFLYGVFHKLHWQAFAFFWPPTPLRWHFPWYKGWQIVDIFEHLPTLSCKCSLWTTTMYFLTIASRIWFRLSKYAKIKLFIHISFCFMNLHFFLKNSLMFQMCLLCIVHL